MPLPQIKRSGFSDDRIAEADHYFATVHGDVAALQARIEHGFSAHSFESVPESRLHGRIERVIESVSRGAGVVGLLVALEAIFYVLH